MHNNCKGVPKCNNFAEITFGYTDERNEMQAKEKKPVHQLVKHMLFLLVRLESGFENKDHK